MKMREREGANDGFNYITPNSIFLRYVETNWNVDTLNIFPPSETEYEVTMKRIVPCSWFYKILFEEIEIVLRFEKNENKWIRGRGRPNF